MQLTAKSLFYNDLEAEKSVLTETIRPVSGFVRALRNSGFSTVPLFSVFGMDCMMALDTSNRYPVATSTGSKTNTHSQLNISWTVAAANDLLNWFRSAVWPMATIVLVTVVPMLVPIIMGMAGFTGRTTKQEYSILTTSSLH